MSLMAAIFISHDSANKKRVETRCVSQFLLATKLECVFA